jgi:hypothetical protein
MQRLAGACQTVSDSQAGPALRAVLGASPESSQQTNQERPYRPAFTASGAANNGRACRAIVGDQNKARTSLAFLHAKSLAVIWSGISADR